MNDTPISIAAIRFTESDPIDSILEYVARTMVSLDCRVEGYLQREVPDGPGCCAATFLEDLATGEQLRITQALGSGSRGCRLDPRALAEVSGRLLSLVDASTDLLVLNRFGKGESEGQGFRAVIESACSLGVPVLTAVRPTYEPAWTDFAGDVGVFLPPDAESVSQWAMAAVECRKQNRYAA